MTAEVLILNKIGVAIAADSTVTIATSKGDKTYNNANKLFSLSKYHPVGILIWNATEFNTIPLEVLIKEFRESIGKREYATVTGYSNAFIRYLRTSAPIERVDQTNAFRAAVQAFCFSLRGEFIEECQVRNIPITQPVITGDSRTLFTDLLNKFETVVTDFGRNRNFQGITEARLRTIYPTAANDAARQVFNRVRPTPAQLRRLVALLYKAALSNVLSSDMCGIVIAGYGAEEHYPCVVSHETDGIYANRLKIVSKRPEPIRRDNQSMIAPFAQRVAANLFVEGVDQTYQDYIDESISDLISGLAEVSAKYFKVQNRRRINSFKKLLSKTATDYIDVLNATRWNEFIRPVLDAVRVLDKAEMATLAESIVSLTALKQKISLDIETVGGPIDVAFISKGDGFIWIKRKHYFDEKLNPFFFKKYLPGTT